MEAQQVAFTFFSRGSNISKEFVRHHRAEVCKLGLCAGSTCCFLQNSYKSQQSLVSGKRQQRKVLVSFFYSLFLLLNNIHHQQTNRSLNVLMWVILQTPTLTSEVYWDDVGIQIDSVSDGRLTNKDGSIHLFKSHKQRKGDRRIDKRTKNKIEIKIIKTVTNININIIQDG